MRERKSNSLMAVAGMFAVGAIITSALSLREGVVSLSGREPDNTNAVVMATGVQWESAARMDEAIVAEIVDQPEILNDRSGKLASAELVDPVIEMPGSDGRPSGRISIGRGIGERSLDLRPNMKMVRGRNLVFGKYEVIVGEKLLVSFPWLEIGSHVWINNAPLEIVGTFKDGGSMYENEVWADARVMSSLTTIGGHGVQMYSSVIARLENLSHLEQLNRRLSNNAVINARGAQVHASSQVELISRQTRVLTDEMNTAVLVLGVTVGSGALFGAMTTLFASVSIRERELAILRSLGFSGTELSVTVMCEALVLGVIGSVLGTATAVWITSGVTIATFNSGSNSDVQLVFATEFPVLATSLLFAIVLSIVGAVPPCVQMLRKPIVRGIRAT